MSAAVDIAGDVETVPVVCECGDPMCTEVLLLARADYEAVRRNARRFLHSTSHVEDEGSVVEVHDGYVVIEKTGRAGEIAEELARG